MKKQYLKQIQWTEWNPSLRHSSAQPINQKQKKEKNVLPLQYRPHLSPVSIAMNAGQIQLKNKKEKNKNTLSNITSHKEKDAISFGVYALEYILFLVFVQNQVHLLCSVNLPLDRKKLLQSGQL